MRCDRRLPGCLNCARVRTKCQGYGKRLFWPRENDPKRSMIVKVLPRKESRSRPSKFHIIDTSFRDLQIHKFLADPSTRSNLFQRRLSCQGIADENTGISNPAWTLPEQLLTPYSSWKPYPLEGRETELIRYCMCGYRIAYTHTRD